MTRRQLEARNLDGLLRRFGQRPYVDRARAMLWGGIDGGPDRVPTDGLCHTTGDPTADPWAQVQLGLLQLVGLYSMLEIAALVSMVPDLALG